MPANPCAIYIRRDESEKDEVVLYFTNEELQKQRLAMTREAAETVIKLFRNAIDAPPDQQPGVTDMDIALATYYGFTP